MWILDILNFEINISSQELPSRLQTYGINCLTRNLATCSSSVSKTASSRLNLSYSQICSCFCISYPDEEYHHPLNIQLRKLGVMFNSFSFLIYNQFPSLIGATFLRVSELTYSLFSISPTALVSVHLFKS